MRDVIRQQRHRGEPAAERDPPERLHDRSIAWLRPEQKTGEQCDGPDAEQHDAADIRGRDQVDTQCDDHHRQNDSSDQRVGTKARAVWQADEDEGQRSKTDKKAGELAEERDRPYQHTGSDELHGRPASPCQQRDEHRRQCEARPVCGRIQELDFTERRAGDNSGGSAPSCVGREHQQERGGLEQARKHERIAEAEKIDTEYPKRGGIHERHVARMNVLYLEVQDLALQHALRNGRVVSFVRRVPCLVVYP